eukprot:s583_g28.t1
MGLAPDCLDVVPGEPAVKRQRQNSLIGNGFHIYSVMAIFCLLPQTGFSTLSGSLRLEHFPELLCAADVAAAVPTLFPDCVLAPGTIAEVSRRLAHCDLRSLQAYTAWCRLRGLPIDELGPQPLGRAKIYSGLSGQRHPTDSSKGLDHLLPPGLGKTQHMVAASALPSPFCPQDWPEIGVAFVVESICVWQQFLPAQASRLRRCLTTVATAVQPLEEELALWRVESAHRVASSKRPGFVAMLGLWLSHRGPNCSY